MHVVLLMHVCIELHHARWPFVTKSLSSDSIVLRLRYSTRTPSPRYVYCPPETRLELEPGLLFRRWLLCVAGLRLEPLQCSAALQLPMTDVAGPYDLRPKTVRRDCLLLDVTIPRRASILVQQRMPRLSPDETALGRPRVMEWREQPARPPVVVGCVALARAPMPSRRRLEMAGAKPRAPAPGEPRPAGSLRARRTPWTATRLWRVETLQRRRPLKPAATRSTCTAELVAVADAEGAATSLPHAEGTATMAPACASTPATGLTPVATRRDERP